MPAYFSIHSADDVPLRHLFDVAENPTLADDILSALRRGHIVAYHFPPPATVSAAKPAPVKPVPAKAKNGNGYVPKALKASPPAKTGGWRLGDEVYLAWDALREDIKVHHSSYRNIKGVIKEKRPGHHPNGVSFDNDPVLVWLDNAELSTLMA